MNGTKSSIRRTFASAVAISAFVALSACSAEVDPPSQNINKVVEKDQKAPSQPTRTGGPRLKFKDDLGTAKPLKKKTNPAGSGTRNRMDFGDNGL